MQLKEVREIAGIEFSSLPDKEKVHWEAIARSHLERQHSISSDIMRILKNNPSISYHGIAMAIGEWCSAPTIQRWVTSKAGYKMYKERVIPYLSSEQCKKQLSFAKRFVNNWDRGPGKYLLIHYDEKWFWGLLLRNTAKWFEGVEKDVKKFYHKCHVTKTMGIAVVGIGFQDTLENGGEGVKILFQRAQSAKVAQRLARNKNGDILRRKGDVYWVDCNVTGSSHGTCKDPKFPLIEFFRHSLFPAIESLIGPEGNFHGYTPVIQGDNAGPHIDATLSKFVRDFCTSKGWLWEPQGPQMPHINVLDLAVFPAMSRRHCSEARRLHGVRVLREDDIWTTAVNVWKDLPLGKIANSFVLARRIAQKIIFSKGQNEFLANKDGTIASGIRRDFIQTENGNARKDGIVMKFESKYSYNQTNPFPIKDDKELVQYPMGADSFASL